MGTKDINIETGQALNDIVFSRGEIGMGNRHLLVKYMVESKNYYIQDMGEGTGTFIQVDKSINLQNDFVISFGSSHIHLNITPNAELKLDFVDGPSTGKSL